MAGCSRGSRQLYEGCVGHNTGGLSSEANTHSRVDTEIMIFSRRMAMVFLFGKDEDAM